MATLTSTDGILITYSDEFGSHQVPLGAVLLAALQDVALLAPNNGDLLTYNAAAAKWLNAPAPASGSVLIATASLSSAQLLALSTTPILLVAAPGAGKYISPIGFTLEYTYGGTAYSTPLNTNNAFINYVGQTINSTNAPIAIPGWGVFVKSTASSLLINPVGNAAATITLASALNQGMQFGAPNALTLGNGTLKVIMSYTIITA
jgi:hypothetical protein